MRDLSQLSDEELIMKLKQSRTMLWIFVGSVVFSLVMLLLFSGIHLFIAFLFLPFSPAIFRYRNYLNEARRRNLRL